MITAIKRELVFILKISSLTRSRILSQSFLTEGDYAAWRPFPMPRHIYIYSLIGATGEGGSLAFSEVEMQLQSTMHRRAPTTKNYLAQNVSRAEVGKLCLK